MASVSVECWSLDEDQTYHLHVTHMGEKRPAMTHQNATDLDSELGQR